MDKIKKNSLLKSTKQHLLYLFVVSICFACGGQDEKQAAEFFGRGVYHYKKNELDDALRFFTEALKKNPKLADAHNNIGLIYELRGKYNEAADEFAQAAGLDPTFSQSKFNQARILSSLGDNATAQRLFKEVESDYKDSVNFYIERGQLFVASQQVENGVADFERAISMSPKNSQALTNLGYAYILLTDFKTAEDKLLQAIDADPTEATAYNNLAFLYGILDSREKALKNAEMAVKLDPNNKIFENNLTYSLLLNDRLQEAQKSLDLLEKTLGDNSYYLRNVGVLNFLQGNFAQADVLLKSAEQTDPSTFLVYYYLGKNSLASNNTDEAKKYFTTGSKLSDQLSTKELRKLTK